MITSKSTDSSFIRYLINVRAPTPFVCPCSRFLSIPACHYGSFYYLLRKGKPMIHISHFGLLLLRLIYFLVLAGVTIDPKLNHDGGRRGPDCRVSRQKLMVICSTRVLIGGGKLCHNSFNIWPHLGLGGKSMYTISESPQWTSRTFQLILYF